MRVSFGRAVLLLAGASMGLFLAECSLRLRSAPGEG